MLPSLDCLTGRTPEIMAESDYQLFAVLLPLVEKDGVTHVLFEVRAPGMTFQPGGVCFPGGHVEENERQRPETAAIRETVEELGIKAGDIEVAGPLDLLPTPQGGLVYPFVGRILTRRFEPNPTEVAEVFTVPLSFFEENPPRISHADVATRYGDDFPVQRIPWGEPAGWQNRWSVSVYYYDYRERFIWGMTAKILHNFLRIVDR